MIEVINVEQGSTEWMAVRCGRATASRMADLLAKTKAGWGASRANYMAELAVERLTGKPTERFATQAMRDGTDREPIARSQYEFMYDRAVSQVGFVKHPTIDMAGCSPDGLVGDEGLIEIKAPQPAAHLETLLSGEIPDRYLKQIHWQMACCRAAWTDFVSFNPDFPPAMQLFVKRVERDMVLMAEMESAVRVFLAELDGKVAALQSRYGVLAEAA